MKNNSNGSNNTSQVMLSSYPSEDISKEIIARKSMMRTEIMAVIAQCHIICDEMGWNYDETEQMGIEQAMDRISGKTKKTL